MKDETIPTISDVNTMDTKQRTSNPDKLSFDSSYREFLTDIKKRYQSAQLKAAHYVNNELIQFYWQLGKDIIEKQTQTTWGSKFLDQLSQDMLVTFPQTKGFSVRNMQLMRQFAESYPDEITKQPVSHTHGGILLY